MIRCITAASELCSGCGQGWSQLARRWKSKRADHWAKLRKKQTGTALALKHFDHFYPEKYGPRWRSIRLALLCQSKPTALVNHYSNVAETTAKLTSCGSFDLTAEWREQISRRQGRLSSLASSADPASLPADADSSDGTADETSAADPAEARARAEAAGQLRLVQPTQEESAALHDYVPATQLHGDEDWLEEGDYFQYGQEDGSLKVALDRDSPISIPDTLRVFSFPAGEISRFPFPSTSSTGVRDYYPLDGASLLPVLALDVQPGDEVLDLCAAPGGKSLAILQTLYPALLVCNDTQGGRVKRLQQVLLDYLPAAEHWPGQVSVTKQDGQRLEARDRYDKVLVDAPCFSDRHSLLEDDNNIFAISRSRERIQIPLLQTNLLRRALEAVRPGGTVVYSTCTLSPIQNDGVVHMALKQIWEDTDIQVVVKDMEDSMKPFYGTMWFARGVGIKYGQQVLPSVVNNFGPMYFAKIVRLK
ncbi:5-methylcytosine rRNA methyltransferase NSUN4-like [Pollicipes pollicipes]|uniref:5-methylcytosine rRNA methyltransferase NSUN4-like n=1 Tax=Pollicipes pollicipes TaxID=41117 RepID=UPI001884D236|nr:5-methylcytosine rRNA methyltransferase NSUN4-like [Pollicipes pollicipes]